MQLERLLHARAVVIEHFDVEPVVTRRLRHAGQRTGDGIQVEACRQVRRVDVEHQRGRAVDQRQRGRVRRTGDRHRQGIDVERRGWRCRTDVLQAQRIDHQRRARGGRDVDRNPAGRQREHPDRQPLAAAQARRHRHPLRSLQPVYHHLRRARYLWPPQQHPVVAAHPRVGHEPHPMRTASDTLQHRRTARLRRFDARERPLYLHPRRLVGDDHVRSNDGGGDGT